MNEYDILERTLGGIEYEFFGRKNVKDGIVKVENVLKVDSFLNHETGEIVFREQNV